MSAKLPRSLQNISLFLERLPGIGEKSAKRLAFYLLRLPDSELKQFANQIASVKELTKKCKVCMNLSEEIMCAICEDLSRDKSVITVVEDTLDLLSMETGNIYNGVYHVLHGRIDPLNHIGPEHIYIDKLIDRLDPKNNFDTEIKEIVLATNPDMEGEATAMYIKRKLQDVITAKQKLITITRLGYGLPMGGNLEYADYMTLKKALENRQRF